MARRIIKVGMGRQAPQPRSPSQLRAMALTSADPIIREALIQLALFIEQDDTASKEAPWSVRH